MISVVIPLYNKEKQIAHTLQSVLNQTFQNFEVVIVDDGSTDGSVVEVGKFKDSRIRLVHQQNAGVSAARNRGIEETKGELIAFLDADDEWKPEYLATQYHLYQKYPDCSVYACNYEFRDSEGKVTPTIIRKIPFAGEDGILSNYFEVASCSHPPICSISVMVKKEAIQAVGGFPLDVSHGEDLLTWANLAIRNKIAYSRQVCSIYCLKSDYGVNSKPINIPQGNLVGSRLESLLQMPSLERRNDLKKYIGRWYKIRSHIFLRGGEKKNAFINICRAMRFQPNEWQLYVFLILLIFPVSFVNYLFRKLR
ncbi:glycosyltransferase family 2 protein [Barnesiella viscericola]|uniref:glycosyltransferase family 2 protein n=1 Tax=Barnesiella viscericola TaxID=397865 RepID=UPI00235475B5|nr:glycosyltransferase family A protein [Barnesiella viscericola]